MEPDVLSFAPTGAMQKLTVLNTSNERHAIKIKCSDNLTYRVCPVSAFVEPGATADIGVLRMVRVRLVCPLTPSSQNGPTGVNKLVVVGVPAPKDATDPRVAADSTHPQAQMLVLPLTVQA